MWDRPEILDRLANALIGVAFVIALYGAVQYALRLPIFPLREVNVTEPVTLVSHEELRSLVGRELRGNFFTLDLAATRTALARLPWVRSVSMRRRWPDRLEVTLEEHVPLARWGESALVNSHGEVFAARYDGNLPLFLGPQEAAREMAIRYEFFRRTLAAIGRHPVQVQVTPRRAWQVRLDDGITIELGREEVEARLTRFVAAYGRTLGRLEHRIEVVDLRYANGFAVRVPELRNERKAPAGRKGTA